MATLSDPEIHAALTTLPGWELADGAITREYRLADFPAAVAFVVRLSFDAEGADHHPDLDIRFNRVRVTLSTHRERGVTAKDVALARVIDAVAAK